MCGVWWLGVEDSEYRCLPTSGLIESRLHWLEEDDCSAVSRPRELLTSGGTCCGVC